MTPAEMMATSKTKKTPPKREPKQFKTPLKTLRESLGLSIRDVARGSGVDHQTIANIEKLAIATSVLNAIKLARFFGMTVEELFVPIEQEDNHERPDTSTD